MVPNELFKPLSEVVVFWRRGQQYATFAMKEEFFIRFTDFVAGINECKNIVGIKRYPRCAQRAHGIANNEDLAANVLKHDWPTENDTKNEDGIQHACFS